jgi:hypothetical protein
LGLFFVFSTGAAFIDKETKTGVLELKRKYEELDYKTERMIQLEHQRHQELLKVLKEIRDLSSKKPVVKVIAPPQVPAAAPIPATAVNPTPVVVTPPAAVPEAPDTEVPASASAAAAAPAPVTEAPAPTQAATTLPPPFPPASPPVDAAVPAPVPAEPVMVEEMGRADTANPETPPNAEVQAVEAAAPVAIAPAAAPLPEIKVAIPDEFVREIRNSQSFSQLAMILAGISLVSMGFLIVTVRKSDERLRRMVWKSEVDHLRDEVMGGRPHLKVERSYDRLTLTNTGSVADDIRLSLGPAPATMKQRLKVLARIEAGEMAEVEIGPQATGGQIYGTLEYKNPDNERIYKDQFVLKIDGVTGELIPIQQAS